MKKVMSAILLLIFMSSCEEQNLKSNTLEGQAYALDDFFEHVSKDIDVVEGNVLYIDYMKEFGTDEIRVVKIEEKKPDFFVLASESEHSKANYIVECVNGDDSWNSDCVNKFSCGALIADCLDQGGCATICNGQIIYVPPIKKFHVIRE